MCAFTAGCLSGSPPWGERTKDLNRVYCLDGRDDRRIIYRDSETPQAPLTLLFVHGLASNKGTWQFVAPAFEPEYRVILIDLLGHGDSDKPARYEYSMGAQGDLVRKFILEKDLPDLVVIGCSYGGGVTLEALLPLFRAGQAERIRGVVLIGAAALDFKPPPEHALAEIPIFRELVLLCLGPDGLARRLLTQVFWRDDHIPAELIREYARAYRTPGAVRAALYAGLEIVTELRARRHEPGRYAPIDCPVLILWGDHDAIVPQDVMRRLVATLPNARGCVVAACGHTPQEEQPAKTTALVQTFLRELRKRGAPSHGQESKHPAEE
jgi:pimeloyl-ACP methyl ester carboxylesterase